eukprot:gene14301-30429_t
MNNDTNGFYALVAFTGMNNDTNGFYALGSSISNVRFEYEDQDGIVKGLFNGQFHGLGHQLLKFINNQSTDMLDALGGPPVTNYSVGLFREIGAAGVLRDFQMVEGFFSLIAEAGGYPCYVGTVAGINNGLIHKVYSNAELRGLLGISAGGGLVGVNNGTIRQSQYGKLTASTRGGDFVSNFISNPGLIAGQNTGLIEDSVSTSGMRTYRSYTDRSYTDVIEIAGSNTGTINRSYVFKGANQVIDNNGVRTPTTTEMQQAATFAGWDIGTDPDGDSVWRIFEGQSTPLLRDFRRRVNIQARRAYNGEIQTESTASGRNAGYHAAAPDLRPLGDEITGGLKIDPVSLVVTSSDLHRVYDGTTQANAAQAVVVNGQLFGTDILSGGSFAFTDRDAGTGKTVTVSGVTVDDGNNGANYTLSQVNNTTSTITAAPLQIAADAAHKTYDGTTNAHSSWQLVGGTLHGTDSIGSVTLVYDNRHAGTGKALNLQSAVVSDGNNGANYALSLIPNLASSITAAPLQIAPDAAHKAFDGTTDASTTWRIGSGTVFAGDSVDDVVVRYYSPDVGVNKRLNLTSVAVNDGNSGANYQVSLADNAASSIALPDAEAARLEQSQTTARQTSGPAARSSNPFAQLLVLDCGVRLPGRGLQVCCDTALPNGGAAGAPSAAPTMSTSNTSQLQSEDFDTLDAILDDLRTRGEDVPQWEFCEGAMAALLCTRRPVEPAEFLPMLLGTGPLPTAPQEDGTHFANTAQYEQFMALWSRRSAEVSASLAASVETLEDERSYHPELMDVRGAVAALPEAERADFKDQELPAYAQVWALGFMFAVENWPEDWAAPRDKEAAKWLDDALERIVALTEDDTGKPTVN